MDRRTFLKTAGLGILGFMLGGKNAVPSDTEEKKEAKDPSIYDCRIIEDSLIVAINDDFDVAITRNGGYTWDIHKACYGGMV